MRILRVVYQNFRSYEFLDLDLSELDTAAIVGEVGAGKTAFIEGITFGLWGKTKRVDFIRDDMDECVAQIDFEARGDLCTVIRTVNANGRNSSLEFIVNGVNSPRHIKAETQAEIDKKIGLDYESMIAGPIMLQGDSGHLMNTGPSDRKDMLIRMFGVDRYEAYHKQAGIEAAGYQREADALTAQMTALEATASEKLMAQSALSEARFDLVEAMKARDEVNNELIAAREQQVALREQARHADTLRATVAQLAGRIDSDTKEYNRLLRSISDAHQTVDIPKPEFEPLPDVSQENLLAVGASFEQLSDGLNERRRIEAQLPALQTNLDRSKKLAAIVDTVPCGGQGIYATCRFLTSAPKAGEIDTQTAEIDKMSSSLLSLPDAQDVAQARQALDTLVAQGHAIERQSLQQQAAVQQWELKTAAARQTVSTGQDSLTRLESQIARDQGVLERSRQQLAQFQQDATKVDAIDTQVMGLKAQADEQTRSIEMLYQPAVTRAESRLTVIEDAEKQLPALSKSVKENRAKAETYTLLAKAFHRDGIPTLILENGIPLIEEQANEILARMPGNYRVHIATQREKKKGGMAERVDIIVDRPGGTRHYEDLSGGQEFRVDFAMRVAIARVLSDRAGSPIETLIFDEGWGTQDAKGVEAMLESLAAVQGQFKLVLVITHLEPVIQRFQTRLEVVLGEDLTSSVSLVA